MAFQLPLNKTATITVTPVDAAGTATSLSGLTNVAVTSDNTAVATVAPNAGFPGQFVVTAVAPGSCNIVVSATNEAGQSVSTSFPLSVLDVTTGFTATFTVN